MRVKMIDIAREAAVSTATVGRVLYGTGYVSKEARQRVEAAVRKFGYVPNAMARALKQERSGLIGILVRENPGNLYQRIDCSLSAAAEKCGYHVITLQARMKRSDEARLIDQFVGMRVEGLAIVSINQIPLAVFDKLHALSIPVVLVERDITHPFVDNVFTRDREGFYQATRRYWALGHRHIAFVGANYSYTVERMRLEGFQSAMEEAGVPRDRQLVRLQSDYGVISGQSAMEELLALPVCPTGVVCGSDRLAAGVMQALYRAGKRVPDDVSISGCDNVLAAELAPAIDSIEPDLDQVGGAVMRLLRRRMEEPEAAPAREYLDMRYVNRNSVRAL